MDRIRRSVVALLAIVCVRCGGNISADAPFASEGSGGSAATGAGGGVTSVGGTAGAAAGGTSSGGNNADAGSAEGTVQSEPCGLNASGKQTLHCEVGSWVKSGNCVDPDVITAVSSQWGFTCALRQDGHVACGGGQSAGTARCGDTHFHSRCDERTGDWWRNRSLCGRLACVRTASGR